MCCVPCFIRWENPLSFCSSIRKQRISQAGRGKYITLEKHRPKDATASNVVPSEVSHVFLDFDGTLTSSTSCACHYLLPILNELRGHRICDAVDAQNASSSEVMTWDQLDSAMAACVPKVKEEIPFDLLFGPHSVRLMLGEALRMFREKGIGVHLLTMGTPRTCRALMEAAGYDTSIFLSWLGPVDMARHAGVQYLFDNGDGVGFEFLVDDDIKSLEVLRDTGVQTPLIRRLFNMETNLSKASFMTAQVGKGAVLVDDNWSKNVFDAKQRGSMYVHVDPQGATNAARLLADLSAAIP
eukprot:TRINITY_DN47483_c0_g1_i1.p1 TRINITY_DN47483_c0_g1~~TRINITY_DN47483_c0_g1_i1.p1  ORF type:complete len:297 (-),score=33.58 TRINITY_DN47483_c0_g1_i1:158-1048(-)